MLAKRRVPRNRRIPNRATGYLSLVIRWPNGNDSVQFATGFRQLIGFFEERLRLVPIPERDSVTAHFDATVRKAGGGERRVTLAKWAAPEPLPEFYRAARLAYRQLPKENEDQGTLASYELPDV